LRAVPAEEAALLLELRSRLAALETELEELRPAATEADELRAELEDLKPLRAAAEELQALRRAHEGLQRRLVAERAALAGGIAAGEAGVYGSRSWRYTAPMRAAIRWAHKLKP